jgi:hypothetical protein
MTIRKVANRTTRLAVSATTTQAGIYKAAIVTAQTIKRIANASTRLVPKAHLVADQLIARLLLNPESSGLQNFYDWQYFADQLGLLLNRPARDSFSLSDQLTTSFIIGRGQSYPGLRDRVFATDDRLGLLIRAKRTFTDAAAPQDRPFLFLGKSVRADRVGFSDFILISRIKTFNDSILTADQVRRIVRFNRTFGDTVGMLDAFTLIDGSTFSLNRRITESPIFIGSGINTRSNPAERISFILSKALAGKDRTLLLDRLNKQVAKGVIDAQTTTERKFLRLNKQLTNIFDLNSIASRRIIKFTRDIQYIASDILRFNFSKSLTDTTTMIDNMALGDDLTYDSTKLLADLITPVDAKKLALNKRFANIQVITEAASKTLDKATRTDRVTESDRSVKYFDKFNRDNFNLVERIIIGRFKNFADTIAPTEDPNFIFAKLLRDTVSATDPFVVLSDGVQFYGIVSKQETEPIADQFRRRIDFIRYPHHPGFRDLAPALDRSQFSPYPAKLLAKDAKSGRVVNYPVINATTGAQDRDRVYAGTYLRSPLYSTKRFSGDSLENVKFTLDKDRDDNFTPSDFFARQVFTALSGNIAGTGLSGSSNTIVIGDPGYNKRYSGNATEKLFYTINLAVKQGRGTVYNFSGNTVTAADSDRLFVGNSYERIRMSGSLQERVTFDVTMPARRGLGTRTVLELGISNNPTADASQVEELFYNKPNSIYGKNWFQLAPLYASFVHESDTDYSLDRVLVGSRFANMPRLVGDRFENFSYVLNKDFKDTTLMLDSTDLGDRSTFDFIDREFDTVTLGRSLGFRVSGNLIERTDFVVNLRAQASVNQVISGYRHNADEFNAYDVYVTKADSDRAVAFDDFSRQWTVYRSTSDTVRIGTDTGFRRSGFNLENFSYILDKAFYDSTLMLDSTDLGDRSTFDFIDREFDSIVIGRSEGYRVSGDTQEKMGMVLAKDAKRGKGTNQQLIFDINNFTTADANLINETYANPGVPYVNRWYQLAPYSATYLYETDLENDHDKVRVGSRFSNTRKLSGDPFETIDVRLDKRINDFTLMLDSTDLADRLTFDWIDREADVVTPNDFFARNVNFKKIAQVDVAYTITGIRSGFGLEEEIVSFTVPARSDSDFVIGFDQIILFNSQLRVLGPDDVFIGSDDGIRKYLGLETVRFFINKRFNDETPISSYIGIPDGLNFNYYSDKSDRVTPGLPNARRVSGSNQENASFLITLRATRGAGTYSREVIDMAGNQFVSADASQILELFYSQPANPYGKRWFQITADEDRYLVFEDQTWDNEVVRIGSRFRDRVIKVTDEFGNVLVTESGDPIYDTFGFRKLSGDPYETIDVKLTKARSDSFKVGKTADVYGLQTNLEQTTFQSIKGLPDVISQPDFFRRNVNYNRRAFVDAAYTVDYLINGGANDELAISATVPKNSPTDRVFMGDYIIAFNAQFRGLGPDFVFIGRQSDPGIYHPNTVVLLNVKSEPLYKQDSSRSDPKTLTTTGIYNSDSPFNSSVARRAASQLFELFYNYETDYYDTAWYDPITAGAGSIELTSSNSFTINNWGNRSDKQLGTDSFTIETWVKFTQDTSSGQIVLANHAPGVGQGLDIAIYNGNLVYNLSSTGSTPDIAQSSVIGTVVANTWYHVALVRNNDNITGYLNGVAGATVTSTASIYYDQNAVLRSVLTGRLSNLRVVQGTAEYTGAFTVPITPLRNTFDSNRLARRYSGESLENFSYVLNKAFYDSTLMLDRTDLGDRLTFDWFDVEADTVSVGLPDAPRVSGSTRENTQFLITYRARASVNTAVSGTTVTAADTDRLFLGTQIIGTRRLAGDGLEPISFYFAHPVSDTTIMLDSTDLGDRSTFDFFDREFDTVTLGLPNNPFKVSGSDLERQPFTLALDAKASVEHVIDGYIDAGQLYRDPTFDANQLLETNLASHPNSYYNETWYSLVPTAARREASKLYSSTTVTARDRDRLVVFDDFSRIVTSFLVPRDTTIIGRSEGLRVSYSNQERTSFLVTKQLYDDSTIIDSTTFADRLTFYWADQEFDTVTLGLPALPAKVSGSNLERIPFTIDKVAKQGDNTATQLGSPVTYANITDTSIWDTFNSNIIVRSSVETAPDASANPVYELAFAINQNGVNSARFIESGDKATLTAGGVFKLSAYLKDGGQAPQRFVMFAGGGLSGANQCPNFDLIAGTFTLPTNFNTTTSLLKNVSMTAAGNGWYLCEATFRSTVTDANGFVLTLQVSNFDHSIGLGEFGGTNLQPFVYVYNPQVTPILDIVTDADTDRIFIGSRVPAIRSSGHRLENFSYFLNKGLQDTALMLDSTTFADKLTFDWFDVEADSITLGRSEGKRVSGSDQELTSITYALDAKASVAETKTGLISFGAVFRDPSFAASQLLELFYSQPGNPYADNWYDLDQLTVANSFRYDTYNEVLTSIGIAARDRDRVVMFDSFKRDWTAFTRYTDGLVIGRSEGRRVSYSNQERVSFLVTKELYDGSTIIDSTTFADRLTYFLADQEADSITLGLPALPFKVAGSDIERQPFFVDKTAKQSINTSVSGTTVTAADTDRLFVGQRWGSIRLSGDNQERFSYILDKQLADTELMLDSTTFADRLTFDWFDQEADTQPITDRTGKTLALDAKAGVDHTITGILDIGFLYRDPTFDANQLLEFRDRTVFGDYYNSTWYSPVPYFARQQTETLISSTSVRARDQDRLVIFDRIEFIKLSLVNELDFVTIGSGRGKRVSGDNIENVRFYITKVLADTAPMLDSTNLGDRLTYFLADQEADAVSLGTGIDSKTGFNNLERLNFDVDKGRRDFITIGLPDAPRVSGSDVERVIFLITKLISDVTTMVDSFDFADKLTYALLGNEADSIAVISRTSTQTLLDAKASVGYEVSGITVRARDTERVFIGGQPNLTNVTFDAGQVLELFYNTPKNPYGVGWYTPVESTTMINRVMRKSGDGLENVSFKIDLQSDHPINTTDSFNRVFKAKRDFDENLVVSEFIITFNAKLVALEHSFLLTDTRPRFTVDKAPGRGEFVQSATPTQDAAQVMGLFYNKPGSAYGTNWYTDRGLTVAQQTGFAPSADINIVSSQGFLRTTNYIGLDYIAEDYVGASTVFT